MSSATEKLLECSAKIRNFKCFGAEEQGFDCIRGINLIIGRNNSGKSSLLDLVSFLTTNEQNFPEVIRHKGQNPKIILEAPLMEEEVKRSLNEHTSGGPVSGNHWEYGKHYVGVRMQWCLNASGSNRVLRLDAPRDVSPLQNLRGGAEYIEKLGHAKENILANLPFKRIHAERDIVPEGDSPGSLGVDANGRGATNLIQNFINKAELPTDLVEDTLLSGLNQIFGPDAHFSDILCKKLPEGRWEIYLKEDEKGRIPLSQSGSGLKTVILVLTFLYLVPALAGRPLGDHVFAFEELENNLHPALLRRLLNYLDEQHKRTGCIFFLTTHSNVAIDLFSRNERAQIIHVTHDGKKALCRTVKTYTENCGILDDLDVRASDLLQSNGVVWVEGPSDRIYLNRWIELWSEGQLKEGVHYQCVFYGGRLLAHLSADDPHTVEEAVSILKVNRNAMLVLDSDKRDPHGSLNETKKRIVSEITQQGGIAWITEGREIENYIPAVVVEKLIGLPKLKQVQQYESFFDYLNELQTGTGDQYRDKKPLLAETITPYFTKETLNGVFYLSEKLNEACKKIRQWNSL